MGTNYDAYVARLLTEDELILNSGTREGVKVGDRFAITDVLAEDVPDPLTGENLGSIHREKVIVRVTRVEERLSLAERDRGSFIAGPLASAISGASLSRTLASDDQWREGVKVGDPAVKVKTRK